MELLSRYLPREHFESYEDFKKNFTIHVPENFDFPRDIVDVWAKEEPQKRALCYLDDSGPSSLKEFTFRDISILSKQAAYYFASLGIQKGDRVLTLLRRRWEYWICAVALHRLGAVVIPASIQLREKDLTYRLNAANVKMVLALNDPFVIDQVKNLKEKCPSLENILYTDDLPGELSLTKGILESPALEEYPTLNNDDLFILYFTSGTTGMPKMVAHTRTYPLSHITTARYMQNVKNNGLHLTQADSGWAKFGWGNIYGQWICGSAILGYDPARFSSQGLIDAMRLCRPTTLCIPPTMYRFLLRDGLKGEDISSIQWFSTAGEPLSPAVNQSFLDMTGHSIHEGFGQSETTPITCSFEWCEVHPGSMGKPSPLYDVAIIDDEGNPCEVGQPGEVVMRGLKSQKNVLGLMEGYMQPDGTILRNYDDVYHTGDIAYEDEDGYYWYVGRNDDMIKCSGYRIGPFEIESVLNTHPSVKESAIIGRDDPIRGQVVCAMIVLREGYEGTPELTKELQDYVKKMTAPYKYPRVIEYLDEMPKTTSGKITRTALRKKIADKK